MWRTRGQESVGVGSEIHIATIKNPKRMKKGSVEGQKSEINIGLAKNVKESRFHAKNEPKLVDHHRLPRVKDEILKKFLLDIPIMGMCKEAHYDSSKNIGLVRKWRRAKSHGGPSEASLLIKKDSEL